MNKTAIEYMDLSYNPLAMRCTPVSEGCAHCWHLRMADRLAKNPKLPDEERAAYAGVGPPILKQRELEAPLRHKKPAVIGLQLMGDVFYDGVSEGQIVNILHVIMAAKQHTFLLLTKRPERMVALANCLFKWPDNLWPGVTVENQDAMWRIEELLKIPAAKHWVSIEPCLSAVDLRPYMPIGTAPVGEIPNGRKYGTFREIDFITLKEMPVLDGVVVGGESGPKARPPHPDWIRDIRDACVEAGVPYSLKQWGEWAPEEAVSENDRIIASANDRWGTLDRLGHFFEVTTPWTSINLATGEMTKDPEEVVMWRVGKKAAGRLLDGKAWDEWPWKLLEGQNES